MSWTGFQWGKSLTKITKVHENDQEIFGSIADHNGNLAREDKESLLKFIESDLIGNDAILEGPYGSRRILYTDYIASGKSLNCIEQFILKHVLPTYANTHTKSTVTSAQTTTFRNESKDIIRTAIGANEDDVVLFTGSGVTGAIHKLIKVLNFSQPPVVFCGPFEHHSNLLPWRELDGTVVLISERADGNINLRHLEVALRMWAKSGRPLIGSFSAASNVTGITTDTRKVAALLHKYGAISLWDYAAGAPYLDINMHPDPLDGFDTSKEAVFISMHKFVGSPDAPGLLVASKHLFQNAVPSVPGGGTVLFVSENDHRYLKDIESREEGGTPAIIGSIRAGMALKLKMSVGTETIMQRETELYVRALAVWRSVPELEILGLIDVSKKTTGVEHKLAVFSFLIRHPETGYYLHYNFVTTLLNDLFGIQTRGGCACAGVYAQHLLGIDGEAERRFGGVLVEDPKKAKSRSAQKTERTQYEILRPGFTRLNFPYFISDEDADFVISAVAMVAKHGWKLLPHYQYQAREGSWSHIDFVQEIDQKRLEDIHFQHDGLHLFGVSGKHSDRGGLPTSRFDCLKRAEGIFFNATKIVGKTGKDQRGQFSDASVKDLRWFLLPSEAQEILKGQTPRKKDKLIFEVRRKIREMSDDEIERCTATAVESAGSTLLKNIGVAEDNSKNNSYISNGDAKPVVNRSLKIGEAVPVQKKKTKIFGLSRSIFCQSKNSVDVITKQSTHV